MALASPNIWTRGEHDVSLVRLYLLRAVALFFAIDGVFSKLPHLIHPDSASRGITASLLAALWISAFFIVRHPIRLMPIFLFELVWKTFWLLDYGAPQWLAGTGAPQLSRDLFEIGFFPLPIALIIPWGHVWRCYVRPSVDEPDTSHISKTRFNLVRLAFVLSAIAGCFLILPGLIRPDPAARGMLESMVAGLWVCALLGLGQPLRMLPILLFAFVGAAVWLIDYGLPQSLSGTGSPQLGEDRIAVAIVAISLALLLPWSFAWHHFVTARSERWR